MRKTALSLLMLASMLASPASAQFFQSSPNTDNLATKSEVSAVQSLIPVKGATVPPVDSTATGGTGASNQYRAIDATAPRITRSKVIALNAVTGVGTFDYSGMPFQNVDAACPSDPTKCPVAIVTPLYTLSSGIPKCWATTMATASTVSVKCQIENTALINLSIVTSGLTLNAMPSAGTYANVVVLPPSQ